jgi:hypothetical protein
VDFFTNVGNGPQYAGSDYTFVSRGCGFLLPRTRNSSDDTERRRRGGVISKIGRVLVCSAETANQLSIAGLFGVNGDNHPILNAFLGNTFSGVVDTGRHIGSIFTGPDRPAAGAQVLADVTLGGVRQGVISGGGPLSQGIVGAVTDTVIGAVAKASTPAGLTTLATTAETVGSEALAKSIGLAKVAVDAAIFTGAAIQCGFKKD